MNFQKRYCLYIDESGVPELSESKKYFIVAGVLLPEEDEGHFIFLVEKIKEKYNLPLDSHIHAIDIFEDKRHESFLGKTTRRPVRDLRKDFQNDMWDLIKKFNVNYRAIAVPKNFVREALGFSRTPDNGDSWIRRKSNWYSMIDRQAPMDIGVNVLYAWALKSIGKNAKLKLVFEARTGDEFTMRNFTYIKDPAVFKNPMKKFSKQIKNQVISIAFANKKVKSVGLELADLISYTCNLYFLQYKKRMNISLSNELRRQLFFSGIHKTLNTNYYVELTRK